MMRRINYKFVWSLVVVFIVAKKLAWTEAGGIKCYGMLFAKPLQMHHA